MNRCNLTGKTVPWGSPVACAFSPCYKVFYTGGSVSASVSASAGILLSDTWEADTLAWLQLAHHISLMSDSCC